MLISSVKSTRRLTYHQFFLSVLNFEFSPTERDLSAARLKVYMTQIIMFVSLEYAFSAHILTRA